MSVRGRGSSRKKDLDAVLHPLLEILAEEASVTFRASKDTVTYCCSCAFSKLRHGAKVGHVFTTFSVAKNLPSNWNCDTLLLLFICNPPNNVNQCLPCLIACKI